MKLVISLLFCFCLLFAVSISAQAAMADNCVINNVYVGNGVVQIFYSVNGGTEVTRPLKDFSDTVTNRLLSVALTALANGSSCSLWYASTITGIKINKK